MTSDQAFVLHTRPFRETSQLVNLFGREYGRFSAVSRSSRSKNRRGGPLLQPFCLLQAEWRGTSDLKSLISAEALEIHLLQGSNLYIGLYLNELLSRLVHEHEPHQELFEQYHYMLSLLATETDVEPHLRIFEFNLLQDLGYGFPLDMDAASGEPVEALRNYVFVAGEGMVAAGRGASGAIASGAQLQMIAAGDYSDSAVRACAKRLARAALAPLLGARPLYSRELFRGAMSPARESR
ncbi:MAG: DNA repair protein RecO [Porticoccaceae bacterium]